MPLGAVVWLCALSLAAGATDLYAALGLRRGSDALAVKKAYKKLAMKWHPDHNNDPSAKEKFIEVQKAYDVLSDPASKADYDTHGVTPEEKAERQHGRGGGGHPSFHGSPFHGSPFHGFPFQFPFSFGPPIPSSTPDLHAETWGPYVRRHQPPQPTAAAAAWLVEFYSDRSSVCHQIASVWENAVRALRHLVSAGRVNADMEGALCREYGVKTVPTILLVTEGGSRWEVFEGPASKEHLVRFVVDTLDHPVDVLQSPRTLGWWKADAPSRGKVVLFSDKSYLSPSFVALSFQFQALDFAVVLKSDAHHFRDNTRTVAVPFVAIYRDGESLEASVAGLGKSGLEALLKQHRLPPVPELTATTFRAACGADSDAEFCVIAVASKASHGIYDTRVLRELHDSGKWPSVQFAWLDVTQQATFIQCLPAMGTNPDGVLILRTSNPRQIVYAYLPEAPSLERLPKTLMDLTAGRLHRWASGTCTDAEKRLRDSPKGWTPWDPRAIAWYITRMWHRVWKAMGRRLHRWSFPLQYLLVPFLLLVPFWFLDFSTPPTTPNAAPKRPGPANPKKPSAPPSLDDIEDLSSALLEHPGYTVLIFTDRQALSRTPLAGPLLRVASLAAREGIWRFCLVPLTTQAQWWDALRVPRVTSANRPAVAALRSGRKVYARLPTSGSRSPADFEADLRAWMDLLVGGEVALTPVTDWPLT